MQDVVFKVFVYALSWMFVIGLVGCAVAIPVAAYQLFAVLFESDHSDHEVEH